MRLTQKLIKTLAPGRYTDDACRTLMLAVSPTGGRSWVQRLHVDGRRLDRGLGSCEFVTLAEARATAAKNRFAARTGGQPFAARAETAPTFADAAAETLTANRASWSASSIRSWESTMRLHVLPRLGSVKLASLTRQHVIDCLTAIKSTAEARKSRLRIRQVAELAISRNWITGDNPGNGGIDAALPHLKAQASTHHKAAPAADVPAILQRIGSGSAVADCLRFAVLTAARSAEARGATWAEFDLEAATWVVPASRMKGKAEHRVPLAPAVVAILENRRGLHDTLAFASEKTGRPLSAQGLARPVQSAGLTVHGFRSTFRDWAGDTGQPRELAEAALAHKIGNATEQSYARSDLLARRRAMMVAWADHCLLSGE